ncbi:MAG: cupredoxin domain-containing protein [Leptospirillia bacterium]
MTGIGALLLGLLIQLPPAQARESTSQKTITVTIKDHRFTAAPLSVPPGEALLFRVTNLDTTPEEFESYDMGFEVVVRPGQTVLVPVSGLGKGHYDFFGDFHPGTAHATLTVN